MTDKDKSYIENSLLEWPKNRIRLMLEYIDKVLVDQKNLGYGAGYMDGVKDGYTNRQTNAAAYTEGFDAGLDRGYNVGYAEGYDTACREGHGG